MPAGKKKLGGGNDEKKKPNELRRGKGVTPSEKNGVENVSAGDRPGGPGQK